MTPKNEKTPSLKQPPRIRLSQTTATQLVFETPTFLWLEKSITQVWKDQRKRWKKNVKNGKFISQVPPFQSKILFECFKGVSFTLMWWLAEMFANLRLSIRPSQVPPIEKSWYTVLPDTWKFAIHPKNSTLYNMSRPVILRIKILPFLK